MASHLTPASSGVSGDPAPTLPLNVIELILSVTPAHSFNKTPFLSLINVLPQQTVPLAYAAALIQVFNANSIFNDTIPSCLVRLFQEPHCDDHSKRLISLIKEPLFRDIDWCSVAMTKLICTAGNIALLDHLLNMADLDLYGEAINVAAGHGHVDLLKWWVGKYPSLAGQLRQGGIVDAAKNGHVGVLDWWAGLSPPRPFPFTGVDMVGEVVTMGQLATLQWWKSSQAAAFVFTENHWALASKFGHLDILEYFKSQGLPWPTSTFPSVYGACEQGHVDVLDFWYKAIANGAPFAFKYSADALDVASANGHIKVLEFFTSAGLELRFSPAAMSFARLKGHTAVVKWWNKCRLYKTLISGCLKPVGMNGGQQLIDIVTLCAFGRLDLVAESVLAQQNTLTHLRIVRNACWLGQLNVLVLLERHLKSVVLDKSLVEVVCTNAFVGNQAAAVQWCLRTLPTLGLEWWQSRVDGALTSGHVAVLEVLASAFGEDFYAWDTLGATLVGAACRGGKLLSLDYLTELRPVQQWSDDVKEVAIADAAASGHISVLEWLLEQEVDFEHAVVDSHAGLGPIDKASENGHVQILQWWSGGDLRFHFTELALWNAMKNKHKRVIQWWIWSGKVIAPFMLKALNDALEQSG
ncbi:hypothetical protein BCR44DRAFT_1428416 [Catenaria anguillulae PL171]|uniref:Ankyrin repeat-containing domain protein n=1 Tax=Catenaria anguillulae PL171 TaxID=765915 RepID=A0A1Y2HV76_9FUNG|nr:hypothetical protein BCR44DRAFT_1428416 [Catenaria anguillulae PL171]